MKPGLPRAAVDRQAIQSHSRSKQILTSSQKRDRILGLLLETPVVIASNHYFVPVGQRSNPLAEIR